VKADGLTPNDILQQAQRLMVPLFQRPYVWGKDAQWEPLWDDIVRMAELVRPNIMTPPKPHFLGAVVLQRRNVSINSIPQRWVIDGQQRLTTLQIIIDAVQARLESRVMTSQSARLRSLIENEGQYRREEDDVFKLWPTNRDRDAYREVMGATPPINYANLRNKNERIVQAHKFFSESAEKYLANDDETPQRADALEIALKQLLKIVVIDLDADEDAQEIFETLNSRGVKLSAADLIKNLIFQKLEDDNADTEKAYEKYWKRFETAFWEQEISSGRQKQSRTAVFLNHFLIARTGRVITSSEVFYKFKEYLDSCGLGTVQLLEQIHDVAEIYEHHVVNAQSANNELDAVELFIYRTQAMDVEVVKSIVIHLLDPSLESISKEQVSKALKSIESWLVRRSLMRATTKGFNNFIAQVVTELLNSSRAECGDIVEKYLAAQNADATYWPDDTQITEALDDFRFYRLMVRKRARMILEALEDHLRSYSHTASGVSEQRCPRGTLTIEHIMPQSWREHWPMEAGDTVDVRDRAVQTLGNLTLLSIKLNSKVSNGPWTGASGKRAALLAQSTLSLNAALTAENGEAWNLESIQSRNSWMTQQLINTWPTPAGHRATIATLETKQETYISVEDLISAGLVQIGDILTPAQKTHSGRMATILEGGRISLDTGEEFDSLSGAARKLRKMQAAAGWNFWVHSNTGQTMYVIREEYRSRFDVMFSDDESDIEEVEE
jgi:uncharacterized protein with ParB-like and HNH nuclease domain